MPATIYEKAVYKLHETFNDRQTQSEPFSPSLIGAARTHPMLTRLRYAAFKRPPFKISENGWGEFDMLITMTAIDKGGDHTIGHDLNFQAEQYESTHSVVCLSIIQASF